MATAAAVIGVSWAGLTLAAPADRVPEPRAKECIPFEPGEPEEGTAVAAEGLSLQEVRASLSAVLPYALYCPQPRGMSEVHLTFDFLVGCNGLVEDLRVLSDGGAPASYVSCVADVIKKADFPAHQMKKGMPVTYPVDVAW